MSKKMPRLLKVIFPDGKEVCFRSPIHTFIEVLKWIGEDRIHEIPIKISDRPLVSHEKYPQFSNYTIEILPGWYYIRQADTEQRYLQLCSINESMNLGLKIELGDFKGEKNPPARGATRPKSNLRVVMPDGSLIDYESYRDVFISVIDKLGPRKISAKANLDLNGYQPLLTATDTDGGRVKIADHLYLAVPQTAKLAFNILNQIAKRLCIADSMKIEILPSKKEESDNE